MNNRTKARMMAQKETSDTPMTTQSIRNPLTTTATLPHTTIDRPDCGLARHAPPAQEMRKLKSSRRGEPRWSLVSTHTSSVCRCRAIILSLLVALLATACASSGEASTGSITLSDGSIDVSGLEPDVQSSSDQATDPVDFRWDTFDESTKALSDLEPMPTVLNFFGSWCPPCVAEMPDFEAVSQQFRGRVRFIGLATQDRPADAQQLVQDTGVTYEVGLDPKGNVFADFDGFVMPTTVFISANGVVRYVQNGALDAEELAKLIVAELLS